MLGNVSFTLAKVPNIFQFYTKISSQLFSKTRYREPPLLDTFSHLKIINSPINKRYFRIKDHFKENSPYKELNYNNNKIYISPMAKLFVKEYGYNFRLGYKNINKHIKNNIQTQIISNSNNNSISQRKIMQKDIMNSISPKYIINKNKNNKEVGTNQNENNNEGNKGINNEKEKDEIKKDIDNMIQKNKRTNQESITKFMNKKLNNLNIKFIKEKKQIALPKIKHLFKSFSQEVLYKKIIERKIKSLTIIKPELKKMIIKRNQNLYLKWDND